MLITAGALIVPSTVVAVFAGHEVVAGGLVLTGVLSILTGAVLGRMEGPFTFLCISGNLRPLDPPREDRSADPGKENRC
jgi:hypothetical protein